jgi:hypothetical protein
MHVKIQSVLTMPKSLRAYQFAEVVGPLVFLITVAKLAELMVLNLLQSKLFRNRPLLKLALLGKIRH